MIGNKLRILLTNDDGVETLSTLGLAELLREKGHEVVTVIPKENMSGISGAMSFRKDLFITKLDENTYAVTGTPCDCVNLVVSGALVENNFDLVISGINKGENAGMTVYDSGTVAAARRAHSFGYKALAISYADYMCDREIMEECNKYVVNLLETNKYYMNSDKESFININIPHIDLVKDRCFNKVEHIDTYVGKGIYRQIFDKLGEGHFVYNNQDGLDKSTFEDGCDHDTLSKGKVSISFIKL